MQFTAVVGGWIINKHWCQSWPVHYSCAGGLLPSLKLLPTSLHYQTLLSCIYLPLSWMTSTILTSYLKVFSNIFTFISAGLVHQQGQKLPYNPWGGGKVNFSFVLHLHLCFAPFVFTLVWREKGRLMGEDRWLFKFGLEPIPIPSLVFPLKVDSGKSAKGVIPSPRGAIQCQRS